MIVYGRNAVLEALRGRRRVLRVWAADEGLTGEVARRAPDVPLHVVAAAELARIAGSAAHQGLVCDASDYAYEDAASLLEHDQALVVALDQVQDPQNLGAVCRSAEGAGASCSVIRPTVPRVRVRARILSRSERQRRGVRTPTRSPRER